MKNINKNCEYLIKLIFICEEYKKLLELTIDSENNKQFFVTNVNLILEKLENIEYFLDFDNINTSFANLDILSKKYCLHKDYLIFKRICEKNKKLNNFLEEINTNLLILDEVQLNSTLSSSSVDSLTDLINFSCQLALDNIINLNQLK